MPPTAPLVGDIYFENDKWLALYHEVNLTEYRVGDRAGFITLLQKGAYDGAIAIFRSNESRTVTGPFDKEIISILPASVKYICHSGAGYDNIDVEACTGISISNTPDKNADAVADLSIFLMLGALRQITIAQKALKQGHWRGNFSVGHDPQDKVLGILGMGGIGRRVAKRALAFGMKIQYHNRHPLPSFRAEDATYVSFDELISTSDVISLNLALTPATKHIISAKEFEKMKTGVVIVNTARGALIDEPALIEALASGKVYSVGLDVFETEPKANPLLLENDRVVLSPHIGAATVETMAAMERLVLENIRSALFEGKLLTQVAE